MAKPNATHQANAGPLGGSRKLPLLRAFLSDVTAFGQMWTGLRKYGAIQKPLELYSLIRFLKQRRLANIMEVGTRRGGSLYPLCQLAEPTAKIISLDFHPDANNGTLVERFQSFTRGDQTMTCIRADSHLASSYNQVADALGGDRLSLLYLDGDHSYEGIAQDYEMYSPLVEAGGLVAMHDIVENPQHPQYGVPRFWREVKNSYRTHEFIDTSHKLGGMGIGVLILD